MKCNTFDGKYQFNQMFDSSPFDLCEIFHTIQGEGRDSGAHALFIRLNGCNLRCPWCDTKFSWKTGRYQSQQKILDAIQGYEEHFKSNYIVWTGGEPLLQELRIYSVIEKTRQFYHMLETNGTIIPVKPHYFNAIAVSPKFGEEFNGKRWLTIRNAYIKLVIDDIQEAIEFQETHHFPSQWFFVMARTDDPRDFQSLLIKERTIFQQCIEQGFNYSPRLQIYFETK